MFSVCLVAKESERIKELHRRLIRNGFACAIASGEEEIIKQAPDLILLEMDSLSRVKEISQRTKRERHPPIIALVRREMLNNVNGHLDMDDFIIQPYNIRELVLRIKRLIQRSDNMSSGELIRYGELIIDLAKCEVSVGGKVVMLTFKEYELLKFLAHNRGRVFTREALLNKVWGYDYYGGDRTVDVHIRRLRSKIEDSSHTFIETVRNIGYRFKRDA